MAPGTPVPNFTHSCPGGADSRTLQVIDSSQTATSIRCDLCDGTTTGPTGFQYIESTHNQDNGHPHDTGYNFGNHFSG
ncbi:hypothetical protein [Methanosphaerula palustris]|uniref:hypothetical protein n=1 Tax=Methanosphaerula palustris TaxID=475088 RepID=UPI0013052364|nr:hypothetical protein [Methanosphaerula palustris]